MARQFRSCGMAWCKLRKGIRFFYTWHNPELAGWGFDKFLSTEKVVLMHATITMQPPSSQALTITQASIATIDNDVEHIDSLKGTFFSDSELDPFQPEQKWSNDNDRRDSELELQHFVVRISTSLSAMWWRKSWWTTSKKWRGYTLLWWDRFAYLLLPTPKQERKLRNLGNSETILESRLGTTAMRFSLVEVVKLFRSLNNEVEQNGKLFTSLHLVIQYLSQSPILTKKNQIVRIEV